MRKVYYRCIAMTLLGISVFTGCGNEKAENRTVLRQMGIEYMSKGEYASAIESFESALNQSVGTVGAEELDIVYYKAAAQYASGDANAAMDTYNAILAFDEEAYRAYYLRGCLYCKQSNIESAKADFAAAVKYHASDYELYLNIYENLASVGEKEAGEEYLKQALTIKGSELTNLEYRGQIHYLLGEYDTAILELEEAVKAGSIYANLHLAKSYEAMGENAKAEEYLKTYVASSPADAVAMNELGEMMLEKKQYKEAVSYFELGLACEVIPNSRALMHNLIVAYEYNGNFDKAWDLIQEYVKLFPEDEEAKREYVFLKNRQMKEESTEEIENTEDTENTEESGNSQETTAAA